MRQRSLGKTGLEVSELGLGTWGLSGDGYGPTEESDKEEVLDRALALGITLFETADCYAGGAMEETLGKTLPKNDQIVIVTKLGTDLAATPKRKRFDVEFLSQAFDASRRRLDRDQLAVVLLHNPSERVFATKETTDWLEELKSRRLLTAWGVSAGSRVVAEKAMLAGADVLQLVYNVLYQTEMRQMERQIESTGVGILARSVLGHGLLCGQWTTSRTFLPGDHRRKRWSRDQLEERLRQSSALRVAMSGDVASQRAVALRFVLNDSRVSACILGPRNTVQFDQLAREAGQEPPYLSSDQTRRLATRLTALGIDG